jgi:hypothetical protein
MIDDETEWTVEEQIETNHLLLEGLTVANITERVPETDRVREASHLLFEHAMRELMKEPAVHHRIAQRM